jgi:hypothetical protein
MCQFRTQKQYKNKWICVDCEKTFKENGANIPFHKDEVCRQGLKKCPDCCKEMIFVSKDFRSPKRGNIKWKFLRRLRDEGKSDKIMPTHSCGCVAGHSSRIIPKNEFEYKQKFENTWKR